MARLLLSAPHKSSGKTTLTLGLCAALSRRGLKVQPFKKGPDYIDPMWLGLAAGSPCHNLDFHTQKEDEILAEVARRSSGADITLIEGNMGLFDSLDVEGKGSNAALASLLHTPVVLVIDARGATRSLVPLILGFQAFEPKVNIAGLILNKVAGARHEKRLREVIGHYCDLPILGVVHRDERIAIDERHLGLIPSNEEQDAVALLERIASLIEERIDLEALLRLAETASPLPSPSTTARPATPPGKLRIGISRDAAFGFYYPGDLEALQAAGAELVPVDTLNDDSLPEQLDGLFLGGGFPETQLAALESNRPLRAAIHEAIEQGLPTYAECGGLMYLCRHITWDGEQREMVGILPADAVMEAKPQGRGYVTLEETTHAPWPLGKPVHAHEFHYSRLEGLPHPLPEGMHYAYRLRRGSGVDGQHDGLVYKNLLASYTHLRDVAGNHWTQRYCDFVRHCRGQRPAA